MDPVPESVFAQREAARPLLTFAYQRWRGMDHQTVLCEMALLFHLAVKINDVKRLDKAQG